jgi:hypothetical protein
MGWGDEILSGEKGRKARSHANKKPRVIRGPGDSGLWSSHLIGLLAAGLMLTRSGRDRTQPCRPLTTASGAPATFALPAVALAKAALGLVHGRSRSGPGQTADPGQMARRGTVGCDGES